MGAWERWGWVQGSPLRGFDRAAWWATSSCQGAHEVQPPAGSPVPLRDLRRLTPSLATSGQELHSTQAEHCCFPQLLLLHDRKRFSSRCRITEALRFVHSQGLHRGFGGRGDPGPVGALQHQPGSSAEAKCRPPCTQAVPPLLGPASPGARAGTQRPSELSLCKHQTSPWGETDAETERLLEEEERSQVPLISCCYIFVLKRS